MNFTISISLFNPAFALFVELIEIMYALLLLLGN